jgi:hypothetical protein
MHSPDRDKIIEWAATNEDLLSTAAASGGVRVRLPLRS